MKKLIKYLKPYRLLAIVSPLMMIGEVLADLLLPYLTTFLVNYGIEGISVTDPEHGSEIAFRLMTLFGVGDGERMKIILLFGILMLCITLVGGFFGVLCAWTAATAAQAPVPHAQVSPLPLSQTRILSVVGLTTRTNSVLMRSGNSGADSKSGPTVGTSTASTRSQNTTQCGLPTERQVTRYSLPPTVSGRSMIRSPSSVVGSARAENSTRPMSTVT